MADENGTNVTKKPATDTAKELFSNALKELKIVAEAQDDDKPRVFFPNGIELISITVKLFSEVEIIFKVAGPKPISAILNSGEIKVEHTDKIVKEVIE